MSPTGWVLAPIITQTIGLRPTQLRGMVQRNKLIRGTHFAVVDGKMLFHLEALKEWLNSEASRSVRATPTPRTYHRSTERMQLP